MADPQDKKKKDWSLFGRTEDNAIARAKYKREMGINPKAQTESSAEVSRSAKSMKNPTSRPYDPKDSAKVAALRKKESSNASGSGSSVRTVGGQGFQAFGKNGEAVGTMLRLGSPLGTIKRIGATHPDPKVKRETEDPRKAQRMADLLERQVYGSNANIDQENKLRRKGAGTVTEPYEPKRKASGTYTASYDKKPTSAASGAPAERKPERAASDKSSQAGKMTNFQRMKARQFEKEGVAGRSMTSAAAKRKAVEKTGGMDISGLKAKIPFFGTKKADKPAAKPAAKPAGRSKSELAAWFKSKRQGLAK